LSEARLSAGFSWPATVAGIVLTVAIMAGLATAIRVSAPDKKLTFAPKAPGLEIVQLERLSRLDQTREKLELLDQTPLFLPRSGLAAGSVPATLTDRPGGRVGELYAASLVFQERGAGREILASSGPKSPLEGFGAVTQGRWFLGLARRDQDEAASPLSPRAARRKPSANCSNAKWRSGRKSSRQPTSSPTDTHLKIAASTAPQLNLRGRVVWMRRFSAAHVNRSSARRKIGKA